MYVRYGLVLMMLTILSGCVHNSDKYLSKTRSLKNRSDAQVLYSQQELNQHDMLSTSKTVQYSKEIDVESIEQIMVDSDYVWTVDVPVPLQATEKKNCYETGPTHYSVGYVTSLDHEDLIAFYKQQMELFGWRQWWELDGIEALLLFEKPHKQCAISIRSGDSRRKQDIIISQKTV